MPNVGFKMGTQDALNKLTTITEGIFYLTSDTNRLYIGKADNKLSPVNEGVLTVPAVANLPSTEAEGRITGAFYYATSENVLCVWNGQKWVQINNIVTNSSMSKTIGTVTSGVSLTTQVADNRAVNNTVQATVNFTGEKGITVAKNGDNGIKISGDPITVATSASDNVATSTFKSASNSTNGKVAIAGGDNVTVTASGDTITIKAEDKYVNNVSITNIAEGFEVFGTYNTSGSETTHTTFNPVIALKADADTDATEVKFSSGTATLPVYTSAQVDQIETGLLNKLDSELKAFNAMEYKGTVGTTGTISALPSSGVENGNAYLVSGSLTYGGKTYPSGTLAVAVGEETDGVLTSVSWDFVTGSTADTTYSGVIIADGTLQLNASTGGDPVASVNVKGGTDITVSKNNSGSNQVYTVNHATYNGTSFGDVTTTQPSAMTALQSNYTVEAITGITVSNGHVTGVTTKSYTIKDTNVSLASTTATVAESGTDNKVKVSHKTILSNGLGSEVTADAAEFSIESSSLQVEAKTGSVAIDLVWGTF